MKLRKFISALAVGAMLISSLTVSAFASSPTSETTISDEAKAAQAVAAESYGTYDGYYLTKDGQEVNLPTVQASVSASVAESAVAACDTLYPGYRVYSVFDLTVKGTMSDNMVIRMSVKGLKAAQKAEVIHMKTDGTWEKVAVIARLDGFVDGKFEGLSPVAVVVPETSSVATGETLPIMTVVGLICLVGVAICVSKFKFAK